MVIRENRQHGGSFVIKTEDSPIKETDKVILLQKAIYGSCRTGYTLRMQPPSLRLYLDCVNKGVILNRCEIELQHAVSCGLNVIECNYSSAAILALQDVKILEQRGAVAIDIEYAASRAPRTTIADTKPTLRKIKPQSGSSFPATTGMR